MNAPNVLVVDDDPDIRAMLGFALGSEFTVRFASNGAEAVEALTADPPDAMVLDLIMPVLDGYGVLETRVTLGLAPHTRVVMLSGSTDESDLVRSWALGADAYFSKPTDPAQLINELRDLLAATVAA